MPVYLAFGAAGLNTFNFAAAVNLAGRAPQCFSLSKNDYEDEPASYGKPKTHTGCAV